MTGTSERSVAVLPKRGATDHCDSCPLPGGVSGRRAQQRDADKNMYCFYTQPISLCPIALYRAPRERGRPSSIETTTER